ncbi:acyl-CoA dehydrogenase family protein [Albimonas sp. CAU 1670]|uniref:acyl-CoA dehydrogenase family protein n=1 Tax=Albimonas sp. CAU 1670 TaxID=3032599 RepID=UPI0023DA48B3|nr:acyl-CoA dehydrogenase family protein [Albimonas sp. CAU 1670]MDF2234093.1 acyl-CoA dehydrogenase family protein [Albimonas sp. CAU 1670]
MFIKTVARDPSLEAFRQEVRAFCREEISGEFGRKLHLGQHLTKEEHHAWLKALAARGWLAGHWPKEHGGLGWSPQQVEIFHDETGGAGAPWLIPFGVTMVGPVIYTFGTPEQKAKHLPGIVANDVWWCQGYSEPGSGSDLASLRTRAVRGTDAEGDHYIVNGQKIWTTLAQWADWIFCLVRTDPDAPKQKGISFLLIDMKTPGVTVRKIDTIDLGHHVNEVFFDNVRVPAENLVGEENKGWTYAKFLLGYERAAGGATGKYVHYLNKLRELLSQTWEGGKPLSETPSFRKRLARHEVDLAALKALAADQLATSETGAPSLTGAAAVKLRASNLQQSILETMTAALGRHGLAYQADALWAGWNGELLGPKESAGILYEHLYRRAATIYGGSSEVQRTIIAKGALGL